MLSGVCAGSDAKVLGVRLVSQFASNGVAHSCTLVRVPVLNPIENA